MNMNMNSTSKNKYVLTAIIAFIISIIAGIFAVNRFPLSIENMAEDSLYQNAGTIPDNIKIIAIDEKTLLELGPYSDWDRNKFADLIEILNSDENALPSVIGVDFLFSGTNNSEADKRLASVCAKYDNIVMASTVTFDTYLYKDSDSNYEIRQYISEEGKPYDELAAVVEYGFTNAIYDDDGIVRRVYTCLQYDVDGLNTQYDAFAYRIASKLGELKEYPSQVEIAMISNPGEFEHISMSDVLDGTVSPNYFEGSVVLIGAYEEGMMDSYRVPIDYSKQMYGVEMHANYIHAFLNDNIIYSVNKYLQFFITVIIVALFSFFVLNSKIRSAIIGLFVTIPGYILIAFVVYKLTFYKLNVISVPMGIAIAFLVAILYKYIEMQKKRMHEMQGMLFSMAEAMAETIEGRTPYNANHTKNVANRCIEMLEYINLKHKDKKTHLYFSDDDKKQLYLAAMLHDVGKMDIPLEVMDKPTKLGNREKELRDRLEIISLKIENDALKGYITRQAADVKLDKIQEFIDSLGAFNCGRPLKEEEWAIINEIAESVYSDKEGNILHYLTQEEIDDLHIKAGTLSDKERTIMQSHVIYTDKILAHIQFGDHFKNVRAMAANHHELLNGKGYPKGMKEEELDIMTRILTIMDIYDSLIADDRPYKKPKSVKVAFEILDEEATAGKLDKELIQIAKELYLTDNPINVN